MDVLLDNLIPIAIIVMALLQGLGKKILDSKKEQEEGSEAGDFELPEWARPEPDEVREQEPARREHIPAPPVSSTPPPPPPARRSTLPQRHQPEVTPPPIADGPAPVTTSALMAQIEAAKKRSEAARKQRRRQTSAKQPAVANYESPSRHRDHRLDWLHSPEALQRAVIAREVLGPPVSLRDEAPESHR